MLKNLNKMIRLQSEKRQEWIIEEKRNYKGMQRAGVALSVWSTYQVCRSPGKMSIWGPIVA